MANPLSGFLGFGGKANNDYRDLLSTIDSQRDTAQQARNVFDIGLPSSIAKTDEGMTDLTTSSDWWRKILTGDTDAMAAVSPAINAINDQATARRMGQAQFGTARGGGVNALNQQQESQRMAEINKIIAGVRPEAAQQIAAIGNQKAQLGLQQMSQALTALGLDSTTATNVANQLLRAREQSAGQDANSQRQMGNILGILQKIPGIRDLVSRIPGVGEFLGIDQPPVAGPSYLPGTPGGPAENPMMPPEGNQSASRVVDMPGSIGTIASTGVGLGLGLAPSLAPAAVEFGATGAATAAGAPVLRTAAEYGVSRAAPIAASTGTGLAGGIAQTALKYAPIVGQIVQMFSAFHQAGLFSGSGHRAANIVTGPGGLQDSLNKAVAQLVEVSKTDPQGARDMMRQVWPEFLRAADRTIKPGLPGSDLSKVTRVQEQLFNAVNQMLTKTPELMNVVRDLLGSDPLAGVTIDRNTGISFGGQPTPLRS